MRTSGWTSRTSPSGPQASVSLCSEPAQGSVAELAVGCSLTKRSPLLPADPPPKTCPSQVLGRLLTVRAVVVFLTLVTVTSVLLQASLCKSPALIWARSFPKARGPSPLWWALPPLASSCVLFPHLSMCSQRVRSETSRFFSFLSGSGEVFLTGVSVPVLKGVLFLPRECSSHLHPGSLFSFVSKLCVPLIQSLVGNPQQ